MNPSQTKIRPRQASLADSAAASAGGGISARTASLTSGGGGRPGGVGPPPQMMAMNSPMMMNNPAMMMNPMMMQQMQQQMGLNPMQMQQMQQMMMQQQQQMMAQMGMMNAYNQVQMPGMMAPSPTPRPPIRMSQVPSRRGMSVADAQSRRSIDSAEFMENPSPPMESTVGYSSSTARWVMDQQAQQVPQASQVPQIQQPMMAPAYMPMMSYAPQPMFIAPSGMLVPAMNMMSLAAAIPQRVTSMQQKSSKELLDEGVALYSRNLHDDAVGKWEKARDVAFSERDLLSEARIVSNIGCSMRTRGRLIEAEQLLSDAWNIIQILINESAHQDRWGKPGVAVASPLTPWIQLLLDAIPALEEKSDRYTELESQRPQKPNRPASIHGASPSSRVSPRLSTLPKSPVDEQQPVSRRSSTQGPKDPVRGPPVTIFVMDLCNNLGNLHYSKGEIGEARLWYRASLRLADLTLERFPIEEAYAPEGSKAQAQKQKMLHSQVSKVDGPMLKRFSYLHKCTLQARVRCLTHLALCEQSSTPPPFTDLPVGVVPSFHAPVVECYPYSSDAPNPLKFTPDITIQSVSFEDGNPHSPVASLPCQPTHSGAAHLASDSGIIRTPVSTRQRSSALAPKTPFELFSGLQASAITNSAMSWAGTGIGFHLAVERLNTALSLFKVSSADAKEDIGAARAQAWLGAVCVEIGRSLDGIQWAAGRTVVKDFNRPGMVWVKRGVHLMQYQVEILKTARDWMGVVATLTNLANAFTLLSDPYLALHFLSLTLDPVDPFLFDAYSGEPNEIPLPQPFIPHIKLALWQALLSLTASGSPPWYPPPPEVELPGPGSADAINTVLAAVLRTSEYDVTNITRDDLEFTLKPLLFPNTTGKTARGRPVPGATIVKREYNRNEKYQTKESAINTFMWTHIGRIFVDELELRERMVRSALLFSMAASMTAAPVNGAPVAPLRINVQAHPSVGLYQFVRDKRRLVKEEAMNMHGTEFEIADEVAGIQDLILSSTTRSLWNPALMALAAAAAGDRLRLGVSSENVPDFQSTEPGLKRVALETWAVRCGVCPECALRLAQAQKVFYEGPHIPKTADADKTTDPESDSPPQESDAAYGDSKKAPAADGSEGEFPCKHWVWGTTRIVV